MRGRAIPPDGCETAARDERAPEGWSVGPATRLASSVDSGGVTPDLPPAYLACLQVLEALPANRSGADKTWVEEALRTFREHYRQARQVR